jgi:flavodoxin
MSAPTTETVAKTIADAITTAVSIPTISPTLKARVAALKAYGSEIHPTLRQYVISRLNADYKDNLKWGLDGHESFPVSYVSAEDAEILDIIRDWRNQITKTFVGKIYDLHEVEYDEDEKEYTVWFYPVEQVEIDDADLPK